MVDHGGKAAGDARGVPAERWLEQAEAAAAFTPSEGFCGTAFRVRLARRGGAAAATGASGEWLKILAEPPSWAHLRARPAFYGNPLLFPYAFQVAGGAFTYRGQHYTLRAGRAGRAAHGLVRDHRWAVERAWSDGEGVHLRASISTAGEADRLAEFPFPFRLVATYTLQGTTLTLQAEATNLGGQPMPMGFGIHPYVPVPFTPGDRPADCLVRSDVTHLAVVRPESGAVEVAAPPAGLDLQAGQRLDTVLARQQGSPRGARATAYVKQVGQVDGAAGTSTGGTAWSGVRWSLVDEARGVAVAMETSEAFQTLLLFAPPGGTVVSPVISTCLPDAFNLASRGQPSGMIELAPGQTWLGRARITVAA